MPQVVIYAPRISTFARITAMTAEEKGLSWEIIPTNPQTEEHLLRHPFGKSPAVEVEGEPLFETAAICRYIDEGFDGPPLQPEAPLARAHMTKWINIMGQYMFPATEYGLVAPRILAPMQGQQVDDSVVERALPTIAYHLGLLERQLEQSTFLVGESPTLADIFLFCCWVAAAHTNEGKAMISQTPYTARWMEFMLARPSAQATAWPGDEALFVS